MRTTLDIPLALLEEVQTRAGAKTKTGSVIIALQAYVQRQRALEAFDAIQGQVVFTEAVLQDRDTRPEAEVLLST